MWKASGNEIEAGANAAKPQAMRGPYAVSPSLVVAYFCTNAILHGEAVSC